VLDRTQLAAGALPALNFAVALLIMPTCPLTEARFRQIVEAIQARRVQPLAQQGRDHAT
jgi:Na+/melibiose symporter-like transporter